MDTDERYMGMALDLARQGRGRTSPNPMVGAVLVAGGQVVASGYHQRAGGPHAEIIVLRKAGENANGATLYVNLEPCSHQGRTGPCTSAIIKAGISKVVAALEDPNPLVSGQGFRRLREAGVEVKTGVMQEQARRLNEVFIKYITTKIPFVALKTAMTLDGKTGTCTGESKWISGEKSRHFVHRLRDGHDAVLVGIGTVLKDNPALTTRLIDGGGKDAVRVIVDSKARLPIDARVINRGSRAGEILAVTGEARAGKVEALKRKGVEVLTLPARKGRVDLHALMESLGEKGIVSVLVEGGGAINYSLLEAGLVDKLYFFMAPKLFGGRESPTSVDGAGVTSVKEAWRVANMEVKQFHEDLLLIGYPKKEAGDADKEQREG